MIKLLGFLGIRALPFFLLAFAFCWYAEAQGTFPGVNPVFNGNLTATGSATLASASTNFLTIAGNTTGNPPAISATGGDTNVNLNLVTQGQGNLTVNAGANGLILSANSSGGTNANQITAIAATTTNAPQLTATGTDTNISLVVAGKGTGQINIGGTSTTLAGLQVLQTASRVNDIVVTPAATGAVPTIALGGAGADANRALAINGAGTGGVLLSGTTSANSGLQIAAPASAVNEIVVTPAATGAVPSIAIGGTSADANRNLNVAGAGTGVVTLGQAICTASGATPQTCNGQRGIVTTNSLSTAAATDASFVINNSSVTTSSLVMCKNQGYSGTLVTNGYPTFMSCVPGSSTITVHITNTHASNALNGTVAIGFVVLN